MLSERVIMDKELPIHHAAIKYILGDSISPSSLKLTRDQLKEVSRNANWGWVHLGKSKETLKMAKPIAVLSLPKLLHMVDREGMNFWRPNLLYTSTSAKQRQLRWLNCFQFDFDPHHLRELDIFTPEELMDHVRAITGYSPTLLIRTPSSGYHVYLPLERTRGMMNGTHSIPRYGVVIRHIARLLGADIHAASAEHYMRVPKARNVIYFSPAMYHPTLEEYEELFEINETKVSISQVKDFKDTKIVLLSNYIKNKAIEMILDGQFESNNSSKIKNNKVGRNNAAFTLSLAFKASNYTQQKAEQEIIDWHNSGKFNTHGFDLNEALGTVKHAYEGKCRAPSSIYLEKLTGVRCSSYRILTPRKPRQERRDHIIEIIEDVRKYLILNNGLIEITQINLSKEIKVSLRSLVAALQLMRNEQHITVEKLRIGRSWISRIMLIVDEPCNNSDNTKSNVIELFPKINNENRSNLPHSTNFKTPFFGGAPPGV
ncbi:MAG: hypothetical protein JWM44_2093 [Bacilli bacterium]|nr:hypothetical protein [Bacilli bacterium]